jgi:membrane-bound acyltransferase YfiQ involved in biofilm formation
MKEVYEMLEKYEYYLNQGMVVLAMEYKNQADFLMSKTQQVMVIIGIIIIVLLLAILERMPKTK